MNVEQGKAAYEHYRAQVEKLDREQLIRVALEGLFETLYEHGAGAELDAADYYFEVVNKAEPSTVRLTDFTTADG